jgi:hypothetical protein
MSSGPFLPARHPRFQVSVKPRIDQTANIACPPKRGSPTRLTKPLAPPCVLGGNLPGRVKNVTIRPSLPGLARAPSRLRVEEKCAAFRGETIFERSGESKLKARVGRAKDCIRRHLERRVSGVAEMSLHHWR